MPKLARSWTLSLLKIVALPVILTGCATRTPLPVVAPCPPIPTPPPALLQVPPQADFQMRLRSFFLSSPEKPTALPNTPQPATNGLKN